MLHKFPNMSMLPPFRLFIDEQELCRLFSFDGYTIVYISLFSTLMMRNVKCDGITELYRLEKTSKIIVYNL